MQPLNDLGPRLQSLFDVVEQAQRQKRYDAIWDCCCDHGYLGLKILNELSYKVLYFVDQLPHITQPLADKLSPYSSDKYQVITADAASLHFESGQQHLVILAGINGKSAIAIVEAIRHNHPEAAIDFLLCPTNAMYDVREYLIEHRFSLEHESIVAEKGRYYELLYVRTKKAESDCSQVSALGQMWNKENPDHQRYLTKIIAHYKRAVQGDRSERTLDILQCYQACYDEGIAIGYASLATIRTP